MDCMFCCDIKDNYSKADFLKYNAESINKNTLSLKHIYSFTKRKVNCRNYDTHSKKEMYLHSYKCIGCGVEKEIYSNNESFELTEFVCNNRKCNTILSRASFDTGFFDSIEQLKNYLAINKNANEYFNTRVIIKAVVVKADYCIAKNVYDPLDYADWRCPIPDVVLKDYEIKGSVKYGLLPMTLSNEYDIESVVTNTNDVVSDFYYKNKIMMNEKQLNYVNYCIEPLENYEKEIKYR